MSKKDEALKLALKALEMWCPMTATYLNTRDEAITAIREALALDTVPLAEQPAIPLGDSNTGLQWDKTPQAFNDWWDSDIDPTGNPFRQDSAAYWAWAGWKAATEQPAQQQEPFAEVRLNMTGGNAGLSTHIVQLARGYYPAGTKLYTSPPANANTGKPWVGLTPEERQACTQSPFTSENYLAIEAKLREKNT